MAANPFLSVRRSELLLGALGAMGHGLADVGEDDPLRLGGVTSPGGHALEVIDGTEDPPVAPKLRARDVATGGELGNGTDQSAQSVRAIAWWDPIP